ncbi:hypothetical protein E2F50_18840 [Rhizobium deserti]|uniref:SPOR domain-containing protein n=1 Tax=Rhizobium deserti TaxID=2547961 RepID=A0A4R5UA91_9HYPH|nr:hypothetical protein [Rhizobium deserti]TDK31731.1 hypothetical protein E2F50_18840 [Rhizobium deserti]
MSDESVKTIKGTFATRAAADQAIEHLTQEYGLNRADIFVQAVGSANTSGTQPNGSDAPSVRDDAPRTDGALQGEIEVSADLSSEKFSAAMQAFKEAGARHLDAG